MPGIEQEYDVVIAGGGPAGATLARLLAGTGRRILLAERRLPSISSPETGVGKCCGGLLAPDAQAMLSRLGLGLPREVLGGPQLFAVRAMDLSGDRERLYQRFYVNLDRGRFDRWLLSLVPPEIEVRTGVRIRGAIRDGSTIRVQLNDIKGDCEIRTQFLAGADGAGSTVRRALFADRPRPRQYLAIQDVLADAGAASWFHAFFPPAEITDDYTWAIPKDEGKLLLGAALPVHGAAAKFARLKALLTASGFPADRPVLRRNAALLLRPARGAELLGACDGAALVGEAGGWVSPSSGEGISYALHTAMLLAEAWQGGRSGVEARYNSALRGLRHTLLGKRLKSRIIFSPIIRRALLATGIAALR